MAIEEISLTDIDRKILESYVFFIEGLSHYLGNHYEIVLHKLENFDHSVIKIINGFHTGRKIGAPITDLALKMMKEIQSDGCGDEGVVYFSKNKRGEPMKSTTILIKGESGRIIGLLCINFYLNVTFHDFIKEFDDSSFSVGINGKNEIYAEDIYELITEKVNSVRNEVIRDLRISPTNKNKEIIHRLYEDNIFNIKDSVNITSDLLGITKNTVYLHLRNFSSSKGS